MAVNVDVDKVVIEFCKVVQLDKSITVYFFTHFLLCMSTKKLKLFDSTVVKFIALK